MITAPKAPFIIPAAIGWAIIAAWLLVAVLVLVFYAMGWGPGSKNTPRKGKQAYPVEYDASWYHCEVCR